MLRVYWRAIVAFGLAASLAIGGAIVLVGKADQAQSLIEQKAREKTDAYAQRARITIQRYCPRLTSLKQDECVQQAAETARKGEHDERDLEAQLVTSVWTHYMGLAAIGGTAFGIIGVLLILGTFRENKRSADAAHESNRPWIEVEAEFPKVWAGGIGALADVEYTLVNRGNSPATGVRLAGVMMPFKASQLASTESTLREIDRTLGVLDKERPRGGSAIFPTRKEKDQFAVEVAADEIAKVIEGGGEYVRFLVAIGVSYMFGDRVCHTVKCYDVCVMQRVNFDHSSQLRMIPKFTVTETYQGFAT